MQVIVFPLGYLLEEDVPAPLLEDLMDALHGGGCRVWFGSEITDEILPSNFNENGEPDYTTEELAETGPEGTLEYAQEQKKRQSQGRAFPSRTDVISESFKINVELLSIHGGNGGAIRNYLSGQRITNLEVEDKPVSRIGVNDTDYQPFSLTLSFQNLYKSSTSYNYLIAIIHSATCPGFSFTGSDEAFASIEATIEAQYGPNEAIGAVTIMSL